MYQLDRNPPRRAEQRWLDLAIEAIATGRLDPTEEDLRAIPARASSGSRLPATEPGAGQNLRHLWLVALAAAGRLDPEVVAQAYRDQRLRDPREPAHDVGPFAWFENGSIGYFNIQQMAAFLAMTVLPKPAADEARRWLRIRLAWCLLHSKPDGQVVASCGRIYPGEIVPDTLAEVARSILGLPSRAPRGNWRRWRGSYSASVWRLEGRRLLDAVFTPEEVAAFVAWRERRDVLPPLRNLLSEAYSSPVISGCAWHLWAYPDGFAAWWTRLRSYIGGDNGVVGAVVIRRGAEDRIAWHGAHTDASVDGRDVVVATSQGAEVARFELPPGEPVRRLSLDQQGLSVDGVRVAPVREAPPLQDWRPVRPGVKGERPPPPPAPPSGLQPGDVTVEDVQNHALDARALVIAALVADGQIEHPRLRQAADRFRSAVEMDLEDESER